MIILPCENAGCFADTGVYREKMEESLNLDARFLMQIHCKYTRSSVYDSGKNYLDFKYSILLCRKLCHLSSLHNYLLSAWLF